MSCLMIISFIWSALEDEALSRLEMFDIQCVRRLSSQLCVNMMESSTLWEKAGWSRTVCSAPACTLWEWDAVKRKNFNTSIYKEPDE